MDKHYVKIEQTGGKLLSVDYFIVEATPIFNSITTGFKNIVQGRRKTSFPALKPSKTKLSKGSHNRGDLGRDFRNLLEHAQ